MQVSEVALRPSRLTIGLSDGTRCVAQRPEGVRSGWSGTTADCGYQLALHGPPSRAAGDPARFAVEGPGGHGDA